MDPELADLYTVLGVARGAAPGEIDEAFAAWQARAAAGEALSDDSWERVRYAHDVLSNPSRRAVYDSLVSETAAAPLALDLILSSATLPLLDTPQIVYALVTLQPPAAASEQRRPLNLSLVIDRSTSMRGERLERVMAAVSLLIEKLGPEDTLSVISFSDRAEVVLPAAALGAAAQSPHAETAAAWRDPLRQLRTIVASGATEIYQGLRAGLNQITKAGTEGRTNHLILLTDGHTYGDADECLRLAAEAAARGIGLTAFGLGADWNDVFLDALVAPCGGQSHYIERPDEVLPLLEGRLQGLGHIYARDLALRHSWPGQLTLRNGFKLAPFPQPLALDIDPIPLGDLEGRSPISVLLEFLVAPQSIAARFRFPIEAQFTAAGGHRDHVERTINLVARGGVSGEPFPPTTLIETVRRLNLYRMQEKAWNEAQSGLLDTAAARMRRLTARYMETGDLRLAQQAQLETLQLERMGTMSAEGRKLLKYGTRSLLGQANL